MARRNSADADERPITPTEHVPLDEPEGVPHASLFDEEPKTIRLTLEAGESMPVHQHPDRRIVLYLLEGELAVTLDGDVHEVHAGDVMRFDGNQDISPAARTYSVALLVLAERVDEEYG